MKNYKDMEEMRADTRKRSLRAYNKLKDDPERYSIYRKKHKDYDRRRYLAQMKRLRGVKIH